MKITHGHLIPILMLLGIFSSSLHASIIFQEGRVEGGILPAESEGLIFTNLYPDATGYESVEIESLGMYNNLYWDFSESAATISSEMSGGSNENGIAWAQARWIFQVTDTPVEYRIDASVELVNTRFRRLVDGVYECIPPDCQDSDNWPAGSKVGMLLPGYQYLMDFQPAVSGQSSFRLHLQVPEPSTFLLMATGLAGLCVASRSRKLT